MRVFGRLRWALVSGSLGAGFVAGLVPRPAVFCREAEPATRTAPAAAVGGPVRIIDGKAIAAQIRHELKHHTADLVRAHGVTPGLAVVLVGQRTDSATYVRMKKRAADEVGFHSVDRHFSEEVSEAEVIQCVKELNADPKVIACSAPAAQRPAMRTASTPLGPIRAAPPDPINDLQLRWPLFSWRPSSQVHGILVQLPLPRHINEAKARQSIAHDSESTATPIQSHP